MVTLLIVCIPITALVVGFLVLKSVQIGLRWQIETKQGETPSLDIPNPVQAFTEAREVRKEAEQMKEQDNIMSEWINGPREG